MNPAAAPPPFPVEPLPPVPTPDHRRLAVLLARVDAGGAPALAVEEVDEFARLYRRLLSDLNEREGRGDDPEGIHALHRLAARAHATMHHREPPGLAAALRFLVAGFPALLRRRIHALAAASLIFLTAVAVGLFSARLDAKLVDLVVPPALKKPVAERLARADVAFDETGRALFSSKLLTHNLEVAFRAFAGGLLLGLGTLHALLMNGLLLGGLAAVALDAGRGTAFLALVLPHGAAEFPAILIAAQGGLILGFSLVSPGIHRRSEWFLREARDAAALLAGAVPLFVVAALVESWVTPAPLPEEVKLAFALLLFAAVCAWLALGGRSAETARRAAAVESA